MRKIAAAILCLSVFASMLTACAEKPVEETTPTETVAETVAETVPETTLPAAQTVTGVGEITWHKDIHFEAKVDVTVENGAITAVALHEDSTVMTDGFEAWMNGGEDYLNSYVGKTVEQIQAMAIEVPNADSDPHYVGTMTGDVDAISGATASSVVVAVAVQNAVASLEG